MRKTVALLLPSALSESFEVLLARAVELSKDEAIDLEILTCNGSIPSCPSNLLCWKALCNHCRYVRDLALEEQLPGVKSIKLDEYSTAESVGDPLPNHLEAGIARGVESTLKTFFRVDVSGGRAPVRHRIVFGLIGQAWERYSRWALRGIIEYLRRGKADTLEFFNGRIVPTRAAALAAQEMGISFNVVEVAGQSRSFFIARNSLIHERDFLKQELAKYCGEQKYSKERGAEFFERRRAGLRTDGPSFIEKQKLGLLPQLKGNVLAVFTSSPDELDVAGDQWFTEASRNPTMFIRRLRSALPPEITVAVRMHPNQAGDRTGGSARMKRELEKIEGVALFTPTDPVSSYELVDRSMAVVTFGSTIGLEATYWERPSILAGRALWEDFDVAYRVERAEEVAHLLADGVEPRSRGDAIMIGSYYLDDREVSNTLSWGNEGGYGFFVEGRSYLREKRSSIVYKLSRLVNRLVRKRW